MFYIFVKLGIRDDAISILLSGWYYLAKKKESIIDVLSHNMVPSMKILSESETKKVLSKYDVDATMLPKMLSTDPAAVALKASVGDTIKIEREESTGKYIYYRVVV